MTRWQGALRRLPAGFAKAGSVGQVTTRVRSCGFVYCRSRLLKHVCECFRSLLALDAEPLRRLRPIPMILPAETTFSFRVSQLQVLCRGLFSLLGSLHRMDTNSCSEDADVLHFGLRCWHQ